MTGVAAQAPPWPEASAAETSEERLRLVASVACVLMAIVLVVLDASMVNVALPAIARVLHVTPAASVHIVTAYQAGLVMALLPFSAFGESVGLRRVYTAGVVLFVLASVACAMSTSLSLLILARFVQGLGGAAILSLGVALLRQILPSERLGRALSWNAVAVALASAAGPSVGAIVLWSADWSWLFAINVPLGALVLFATRALPSIPGHARPLDRVSVALNALAFGAAILGVNAFVDHPRSALALGAVALLAAIALVRRELPRRAPMVPFDLLRSTAFRFAVIASVACFTGQSAAMVCLPFHVHHALGADALHTGLAITPWPLTVAVVAPLAGRLAERVPNAVLCTIGGAMLALGLSAAALLPPSAGAAALVPCVVVAGAGFGLFQVPNNRTLLLAAPKERSGAAGGMQATARLTGQTLGALGATLLLATDSITRAPRLGLGLAAVATAIAGLVSFVSLRAVRQVGARG